MGASTPVLLRALERSLSLPLPVYQLASWKKVPGKTTKGLRGNVHAGERTARTAPPLKMSDCPTPARKGTAEAEAGAVEAMGSKPRCYPSTTGSVRAPGWVRAHTASPHRASV